MSNIFLIVPIASIIALVFAWFFFKSLMKNSEGTDRMKEIAQYVREGAMAYLKRQYKSGGYGLHSFVCIAYHHGLFWGAKPICAYCILNWWFFSGLCGFLGDEKLQLMLQQGLPMVLLNP